MWDLNDINAPEPEAVEAEREIVDEIVRNERPARPSLHEQLHTAAVREVEREAENHRLREQPEPLVVGLPITWKRLRNGSWGITGPSALLTEGAIVNVRKRDGSGSRVRVGAVLWRGDGIAIAATRRA